MTVKQIPATVPVTQRRLGSIEFPGRDIDAVIFDLDGVVTDTARIHEAAWKAVFDEFLGSRVPADGDRLGPFTPQEYARHVDGKPRYAGAKAFLEARGIELPDGTPDDEPGDGTVAALANRKNEQFTKVLTEQGAAPYPGTVEVIEALRRAGIKTALITASKNGRAVLAAAGTSDMFDAIIDGNDALDRGIAGKPAPDVFLAAAADVGVAPERAAVVEDAQAGVEAGRRGGFGYVLGVDRMNQSEKLYDAGADAVVQDLSQLTLTVGRLETGPEGPDAATTGGPMLSQLPDALDAVGEIAEVMLSGKPVVFLDYDGTLSPIVDDPDAAVMPSPVADALRDLSQVVSVAIISGRDLADVRERAALEGVYYAGSHGFEIVDPAGTPVELGKSAEFARFLPALDSAESELRRMLHALPGVQVERKQYAIAVHFRRAAPESAEVVERAVDHVRESAADLRKTGGKKIFELRPGVDWDKGRAVLALLGVPGLGGEGAIPMFIGDDLTDEDAFAVVNERGVSIAVRGEDDRPTLARYGLDDPEQAGVLLGRLAKRFSEEGAR